MAYELSKFPETYDVFKKKYDISPKDRPLVTEYHDLWSKEAKTEEDNIRLNQLTLELEKYFYNAEHINHFQDAMTNVQKFFKDNTKGHVDRLQLETTNHMNAVKLDADTHVANKKSEMNLYSDGIKTSVNTYTDTKMVEINTHTNLVKSQIDKNQGDLKIFVDGQTAYLLDYVNGQVSRVNISTTENIALMDDRRKTFGRYVDTKSDEVRGLVQEFDSNSARYYTTWSATAKQVDFNIYQGSNLSIPPEANLNIAAENIDVIINGVLQTPYKDFAIHNNGFYDTIRLTSNAQSLVQAGTEVVAKWYKNVGKLYFQHAHSHGEGGRDQLNVTRGMLAKDVTDEFNFIPTKMATPPNPLKQKLWLDTTV